MSSIPHDQSEAFSAWLDAYVAGASPDADRSASDAEGRSLRAAAKRFHGLSESWNQQALTTSRSAMTWEDLMTANPHALPARSTPLPTSRRVTARHWDMANRFVSVALIVALLVGIGAGAWQLADRDAGTPGTSPTGVPGLAQSGDATPDQQVAPAASPTAMTPIEELPGIQSGVVRMYAPQNAPADIPDLASIGIGIYHFDTPRNAAISFGLLVMNQNGDFVLHRDANGSSLTTRLLGGPGERGHLLRIVDDFGNGYQSQEYRVYLHDEYVISVITVTGSPMDAQPNQDAIDASSTAAFDLATTLFEQGQPSPDDARFYQDGTSTGGDWGFMPPAGDPLLLGLVPFSDQQLFPPEAGATEINASYPPDAGDLTGIVAAVYREYAPTDIFIGSQSVSMDDATPMTDEDRATEQFSSITAHVYELESPKDAAVAFNRLTNGLVGSLTHMSPDGQQKLISEDLTGIGDQATRARLTLTSEGGDWINQNIFQYVAVQRGEFVIVIYAQSSLGPVEEPPDVTDAPDPMLELATQIAIEGEPSPEEANYAQDGTSTGGLWGFMPETGDPLLLGLVPLWDQLLYPAQMP